MEIQWISLWICLSLPSHHRSDGRRSTCIARPYCAPIAVVVMYTRGILPNLALFFWQTFVSLAICERSRIRCSLEQYTQAARFIQVQFVVNSCRVCARICSAECVEFARLCARNLASSKTTVECHFLIISLFFAIAFRRHKTVNKIMFRFSKLFRLSK